MLLDKLIEDALELGPVLLAYSLTFSKGHVVEVGLERIKFAQRSFLYRAAQFVDSLEQLREEVRLAFRIVRLDLVEAWKALAGHNLLLHFLNSLFNGYFPDCLRLQNFLHYFFRLLMVSLALFVTVKISERAVELSLKGRVNVKILNLFNGMSHVPR